MGSGYWYSSNNNPVTNCVGVEEVQEATDVTASKEALRGVRHTQVVSQKGGTTGQGLFSNRKLPNESEELPE